MNLAAKIKQAFLAQAVADAFCYEFEFYEPQAAEVWNSMASAEPISITDDTQMAMFGLYALGTWLRSSRKRTELLDCIRDGYLAWYRTQSGSTTDKPTWLEQLRAMQQDRSPGMTCMGAMSQIAAGVKVRNNSKGNGAVMRTLPFVFLPDLTGMSRAAANGCASFAGEITHLHPESMIAVKAYMDTAWALRDGVPPVQRTFEGNLATTFTALPAFNLASHLLSEALSAGFRDERFKRMLTHACIGNGDSDTVAAIAGGLYGLVHPAPVDLVLRLRERAIIERLVDWAVEPVAAVEGGDVRASIQEVRSE